MPGLPILPDRWRWRLVARLRGPVAASRALGVTVGDGCRILSMNVSSEYELISIGDRVTVSSEVLFITHDGTGWLIRDEQGRRHYRYARIQIGDDVFIGARATLLPGVRIGNRCVVAAGAVVVRSVPDGSVVGGNPARVLGRFDDLADRIRTGWSLDREVTETFRASL